jgi:hypothetical protein
MTGFEIVVWIYLVIGLAIFVVVFYKFDDRRKWLMLPVPLLFIPFIWPWLLLINALDRARKSRRDEP